MLTMGFGTPERTTAPMADTPQGPAVLVLLILASSGGSFANWQAVAASTDRGELEKFLGRWIEQHPGAFAGRSHILPVPFLLPAGVKV